MWPALSMSVGTCPGEAHALRLLCAGNVSFAAGPTEEGCAYQAASLPLLVLVSLAMFYGLALVCEEFMVPSLAILCDRFSIPPHVAGATLLAAGCNAPELIASAIAMFVTRSTVGAGTIVGSAPFNILVICGASALAVGGIALNLWLVGREVVCLLSVLVAFAMVMSDGRVDWYEALFLLSIYVGYVLLCVHWERVLTGFRQLFGLTVATGGCEGGYHAAIVSENDDVPVAVAEPPSATTAEWAATIAECKRRVERRKVAASLDATTLTTPLASRRSGVLLKRSRWCNLYDDTASVRVQRLLWMPKLVLLDDDPLRPLRYTSSLDASALELLSVHPEAGHALPLDACVRLAVTVEQELRLTVAPPPLSSDTESEPARILERATSFRAATPGVRRPTLRRSQTLPARPTARSGGEEHEYVFRAPASAPSALLEWFDELVLRLEAIRTASAPQPRPRKEEEEPEEEEEEDAEEFFRLPSGCMQRVAYLALFPLAAPIHMTTPDARHARWKKWFALTLLMSLVWLVVLATVMTTCLEAIGCLIGFSSTAMGLTLGAAGTSFPNMYASVLAARQGEAAMAIVQARGEPLPSPPFPPRHSSRPPSSRQVPPPTHPLAGIREQRVQHLRRTRRALARPGDGG